MTKTITVAQAARAAKCATQTINRLIREGHIKAEKSGKFWNIMQTREEVADIVHRRCPTHGYKKNGKRVKKISGGLSEAIAFLKLSANTRAILMRLAARFDQAELEVIEQL